MNDLPDRFPRGWFVLGHQRDFPVGETKTIFGFNNKILISRSEDSLTTVDVDGDKSWPVLELNQMVMVWHDIEKQDPDFVPDKIDACYSDDWSDYGMASFLVKNNCIYTHPKGPYILPGITREIIIDCAKYCDIEVKEVLFNKDFLIGADEVWISSSTREVLPITRIDNSSIDHGKVGEIWSLIYDRYQELKNIKA